jgi:hypothetical protein
MSQITFQGIEYPCRSLNDKERKLWDEGVRVLAKTFWTPAEDYWNNLGDIPMEAKKYCLADYLKSLDWEKPSKECRAKAMIVPMVKQLMAVMAPTFPQELITEETRKELLCLLDPYFIEVRTSG